MNAWALVAIAGVLEVVWAIGLKMSDGFTRWFPTTVTILGAAASFWVLSQAMKQLPAGTAYAAWVGIGAVGVAILGVLLFDEPVNLLRALGVLTIVAGVVMLRLA